MEQTTRNGIAELYVFRSTHFGLTLFTLETHKFMGIKCSLTNSVYLDVIHFNCL